jgi:hypothetical protein
MPDTKPMILPVTGEERRRVTDLAMLASGWLAGISLALIAFTVLPAIICAGAIRARIAGPMSLRRNMSTEKLLRLGLPAPQLDPVPRTQEPIASHAARSHDSLTQPGSRLAAYPGFPTAQPRVQTRLSLQRAAQNTRRFLPRIRRLSVRVHAVGRSDHQISRRVRPYARPMIGRVVMQQSPGGECPHLRDERGPSSPCHSCDWVGQGDGSARPKRSCGYA